MDSHDQEYAVYYVLLCDLWEIEHKKQISALKQEATLQSLQNLCGKISAACGCGKKNGDDANEEGPRPPQGRISRSLSQAAIFLASTFAGNNEVSERDFSGKPPLPVVEKLPQEKFKREHTNLLLYSSLIVQYETAYYWEFVRLARDAILVMITAFR